MSWCLDRPFLTWKSFYTNQSYKCTHWSLENKYLLQHLYTFYIYIRQNSRNLMYLLESIIYGCSNFSFGTKFCNNSIILVSRVNHVTYEDVLFSFALRLRIHAHVCTNTHTDRHTYTHAHTLQTNIYTPFSVFRYS